MLINNITNNKSVDVTLDPNELVALGNILYFYEKHHKEDELFATKERKFGSLYAQILLARDLCQYGHIDNFTLKTIVEHRDGAKTAFDKED